MNITIIGPAERRMLTRMTANLIPEEFGSRDKYPVMGFRAMGDLRTAKSLMDKGLLIHLGNDPQPRFQMTDAGIAATQGAPAHWGRA